MEKLGRRAFLLTAGAALALPAKIELGQSIRILVNFPTIPAPVYTAGVLAAGSCFTLYLSQDTTGNRVPAQPRAWRCANPFRVYRLIRRSTSVASVP
jgi:hypothetical protein